MAGPWEKFQQPTNGGPWARFQSATPGAADIPVSAEEQAYGARQQQAAPAPDDSLLGKAFGLVEAPMALASGIVGGAVGSIAGAGKTLVSGKYGTQAGIRDGERTAEEVANALTYQPRTQTGNALVRGAGEALNASGIIGVPIPELNALGRGASSSLASLRGLAEPGAQAMAAQDAAVLAGRKMPLRELVGMQPKPTMPGVGAALTEDATLRAQRAAAMPVPIPLTRGQLTRTFEQMQFEREAAKTPEGKPINDRYAQQNALMGQNMDAFADQTGAQASGLRAAGRGVVDVLEAKRRAKKAEIRSAYDGAREAGELVAPVDVTGLAKFLEENRGKAKLAPIITTIEAELKKNAKEAGGGLDPLTLTPRPKQLVMTLNASEDLRQAINDLAEPGTPNVVYGKRAKAILDVATEDKGGPLYQQARRLFENYSNEFTNRDVIDKLLRTKRGTKDRAVPFEDVFKHTILNGSLDDVRHVRRVLQTAGDDGQQAWRELQGQTVNHLKEQLFSNSGADVLGNSVGSAAKIERLVRELDKDGKLDFIFGKQGAQQVRDARDLAIDLYTSPAGSVNTSNTASAMQRVLDKLAGVGGNVPVVGGALKFAAKRAEAGALKKKVNDALTPYPQRP